MQSFFEKINFEFEDTVALILRIRKAKTLLSTHERLRNQIERSNPLLNTLNRLQVQLLEVRRHGNAHKLVKLAMQLTVNGIASAIPATLLLFFVQDRLQAPPASQALFLGSYFVCAALAMPIWLKVIARIGLARTWLTGMVLAVAVFIAASMLGAGDTGPFVLVCALSGVALGTDLTVPAALLAGTIARSGDRGHAEGAYFGWWNLATKLNLALAAGLALPALGWWGYTPGAHDAQALRTLTWAYCLLPCALKALAAGLLYTLILRRSP